MMTIKQIFGCCALLLSLCSGLAKAQDTNFWTQHYGTRSTLLGGAVIGSVKDLGAVYYNPGLFGLITSEKFLLGAKIYMSTTSKIKDGAGEGKDLDLSRISPAPSLIAGTFKFKFAKGHRFGYSLLTRQRSNASFLTYTVDTLDVLPGYPGDEAFGGELNFKQNLNDLWGGLTWSYGFGGKFGIGLTQYLSSRSQTLSKRILLEVLGSEGQTAAAVGISEYNYKIYRTLTKFGAGMALSDLTAGVTVTTPSLHISGSGSALYNDLVTGGDLDGDGDSNDRLDARLQRNVPAQFKSSWAVGIGGSMLLARRVRFHVSGEWFDKIEKFRVLDTKPFTGQSTGAALSHDITYETESIFNYGFGFEFYAAEKISYYGSFVRDFSAAPKEKSETTLSGFDLYHIAGGTTFQVVGPEITLGLSLAFGEQEIDRLVNLDPENPGEPIRDGDEKALLKVRRLKFIFGFSF
jgi:hypothetical protein